MKYKEIPRIQYVHGISHVGLVPERFVPISKEICEHVKNSNPGCEMWGAVRQEFEDGYTVMIVGYYIRNPDQYADKSRQGPAWLDRKAYFEIAA